MSLGKSLQKVAQKVVNKFGGLVDVRIVSRGTYNTETGTVSESETVNEVRGVLDQVSAAEVGDLVKATDKKLTIAAVEFNGNLDLDDRVIIVGVTYQIVRIATVEQDNLPIIFDLFLRA
jgi:hypothetical protein